MLAGRQPLGVLRWFSCFVSFIWCQLFAWLIREAIFRLPPVFVVYSFYLCHRHLWSVLSFFATGICVRSLSFMAFSAVGIRVRLFVFALALVSRYFSQFLVSCCALAARQLHLWRFELDIFCKSVTLWTALQIPLWSKPHLVFCHKVYEIALSQVLATQMGVTEAQHKIQHSYALGSLWVVTVCCNTVGRHVRAFCRPHAYTFNEQSKMATALTPQTDVTSEKVTWLMENPRQQSRPAYRKENRL